MAGTSIDNFMQKGSHRVRPLMTITAPWVLPFVKEGQLSPVAFCAPEFTSLRNQAMGKFSMRPMVGVVEKQEDQGVMGNCPA